MELLEHVAAYAALILAALIFAAMAVSRPLADLTRPRKREGGPGAAL